MRLSRRASCLQHLPASRACSRLMSARLKALFHRIFLDCSSEARGFLSSFQEASSRGNKSLRRAAFHSLVSSRSPPDAPPPRRELWGRRRK